MVCRHKATHAAFVANETDPVCFVDWEMRHVQAKLRDGDWLCVNGVEVYTCERDYWISEGAPYEMLCFDKGELWEALRKVLMSKGRALK